MEIKNIKKLSVLYNNRLVGYLAELGDGKIAFEYTDEWIKDGFSISPFSLPLIKKVFINTNNIFGGLFGVFQDSLPDGWGELLMIRTLAKNGVNFNKLSPLTKLTLVNNNGLGALNYIPTQVNNDENFNFDLDNLATDVNSILEDKEYKGNLDKLFELGGSSGGARPKAHLKINNEYWIVKFPCLIDPIDIGKSEFEANVLAQKCGINVNEFKLFPSSIYSGYFGVKRFDRGFNKKIHMISLASILETSIKLPNLDYMHLFQVIDRICVQKEYFKKEAYKRMCFNVLFGNKDDHGKNFSFLYDEEKGGYVLSPAYDLTKTPNKVEHEMTVNGLENPNSQDLINFGKLIKLPLQFCRDTIEKIISVIQKSS